MGSQFGKYCNRISARTTPRLQNMVYIWYNFKLSKVSLDFCSYYYSDICFLERLHCYHVLWTPVSELPYEAFNFSYKDFMIITTCIKNCRIPILCLLVNCYDLESWCCSGTNSAAIFSKLTSHRVSSKFSHVFSVFDEK